MSSEDMSRLLKGVTVSRLMKPDDANIRGNVHGGVTLKMIEEAGAILATKYCNILSTQADGNFEGCVAQLARVERTDFLQPMHIGEVAELTAEITFTSPHSLEVKVLVWAENIITGLKRFTNKARLWFVPCSIVDYHKIVPVPPMVYPTKLREEGGRRRYEQEKKERMQAKANGYPTINLARLVEKPAAEHVPYTVPYSRSSLIHLVGASEVASHGYMNGGSIMRLMDECAGIVAARHCRTAVVTASLDTTNFHKPVGRGGLITLFGQPTFTSYRSMEIEVIVDVETRTSKEPERAVDAFFTFVSLDSNGRPQPIPQIQVETEEEKERFEAGKKRYDARKLQRRMSSTTVLPDQQFPSVTAKTLPASSVAE